MPTSGAVAEPETKPLPEDEFRAQMYLMLASYLSAPPDSAKLRAGASLTGDDSDLGKAVATFAHLCARSDGEAVAGEYHDLFIGVGRGELLPYGSYYLTGFLHEKPLAKLRAEMARLGIERDPAIKEPEDHIASVLEIMAGLIDGRFGEAAGLEVQQKFFEAHIASWAPYFFRDLEGAKSSVLYAALGAIGRNFLLIEEEAFRMD